MEDVSDSETQEGTAVLPNAFEAELARSRQELAEATQALQRSEALLNAASAREMALEIALQHRVRNMLATIRTVFNRTMDAAETLQEAADHFSGRLDTLARYESILARRPHSPVEFDTLVRDELLTLGFSDGERVVLQGPCVPLPHVGASLIGLAVHELATNSMKFGALSTPDGRLAVRWKLGPDEASGLAIEWIETGVPVLASAPFRSGFGRDFIEFGLPYQIDARTSFELRAGGLHCHIALPRSWLDA